MEVIILALVIVTMGLAAAGVAGVFAIYASRQQD
jgi:biopolymer transport protein ExbB/TolQ